MKIIIPILGFGRHGGYRVLSVFATKWIELGHEVTFLVNEFSDPVYFPTSADVIWIDGDGIQVGRGLSFEPKGSCGGRLRSLLNLNSLRKGLNRYGRDFNVALANHSLTAWPVYFSRSKFRKVYYVQAYEPDYYANQKSINGYVSQFLAICSYFLRLNIIVNSPIYLNYKFLKTDKFVPPGVNFSIFHPIDEELKKNPCITIGCIGRKEPYKGTLYVLEAYQEMLLKKIPVRLKLAYGNLPEGISLSKDSYDIIEPKNDYELAEYYRSLDIMIAPGTIQLGAPHYPVMEAMACGIPVITTGYMPATKDNSWLVPVCDKKAIVLAVKQILNDQSACKVKVSRALEDIKDFSWDSVANKMLNKLIG